MKCKHGLSNDTCWLCLGGKPSSGGRTTGGTVLITNPAFGYYERTRGGPHTSDYDSGRRTSNKDINNRRYRGESSDSARYQIIDDSVEKGGGD